MHSRPRKVIAISTVSIQIVCFFITYLDGQTLLMFNLYFVNNYGPLKLECRQKKHFSRASALLTLRVKINK